MYEMSDRIFSPSPVEQSTLEKMLKEKRQKGQNVLIEPDFLPVQHSVGEFFEAARKNSSSPAILAPEREPLSYGQLYRHIAHVVSLLNKYGLGRNDRIAVVLPNSPEMAVTFLAVIAGATCAPLNPAYQEKEFDFYLSDIHARAVVVQAGMDSPVRSVTKSRNIPIIELTPLKEGEAGLFTLQFTSNIAPNAKTGISSPDDTALILHTSGTTSRPKIVPLKQRNIFASAVNVSASLQLNGADRCLNVMPLFHIHGLVAALLASLHAGGSVICTSGFSDTKFFDWIEKLHPTWYTAVPTIHQMVLELAEKNTSLARKAQFRFIRSSSSSLPPVVMERLENTFNVPVLEAYGMTEAAHQMASNPMPPLRRKPGSVGLPAGPEIAIMDDRDNILPNGETGEIVIRGVNVMQGYENNPDANEKAFSCGWFRTGDLGYLDEEGYLHISGRLKEILNRGGQKVSPREIDEVLLEHPAVLQAIAFSVPHSRLGEAIAAAVLVDRGANVTERALRQHVADRLAPYKVPQQILFVDSIPKGPTGKVQRLGLAEKLSHLLNPEYIPPESETEMLIAKCWQELLRLNQVGRHDNFFSLGGDSLLAIQVAVSLSKELKFDVPVLTIFQFPTLLELAKDIDQRRYMTSEEADLQHFSTLHPIKPSGTRPPFFWFHSELISYLPDYLGQDQPLYAFMAHGINGRRARYKSLHEITAHYLREIRTVQPSGPYFLGGFCWGGLVAFEIAHQMLQQGEDVALLFVVEPLLSSAHSNQKKFSHQINRYRWELDRLPFSGKIVYVVRELLKRLRVFRFFTEVYLRTGRPMPLFLRINYALDVIHWAARDFIQKPFPKGIVVILAEKGIHPADADWSNLAAGEVTVHAVPGAVHMDMLQEPCTGIWAKWLHTHLRMAQSNNSGSET
jgi:oxalate---CoA ligase